MEFEFINGIYTLVVLCVGSLIFNSIVIYTSFLIGIWIVAINHVPDLKCESSYLMEEKNLISRIFGIFDKILIYSPIGYNFYRFIINLAINEFKYMPEPERGLGLITVLILSIIIKKNLYGVNDCFSRIIIIRVSLYLMSFLLLDLLNTRSNIQI